MILAACLAALLAGQTADTVVTVRLLGTGHYREANPLLPGGRVGIVTVKAAITTTAAVYGWRIRKRHPKWAAGIWVAGAVSGSLATWHNVRTERQRLRRER